MMSGNYFLGDTTKKIACWADAWDEESSPRADPDDLSDTTSQVSDSTTDESQIYDVKQRMLKLFESQLYTDVVFYPKNGRKNSISAHRAILAVGSPRFAKMLFGEGSEPAVSIPISLPSFEAFISIVKYLYTDEIFFESDAHAQAILEGAEQFEISSLVRHCNLHFQSQELTEHNVCSKLQMSLSNKTGVMKTRCIEYIQQNTHKVINSADFQKCNSSTIRTICKLQCLNLQKEVDLLHAVVRWANNQNVPDKRLLMEPLIKCFRFLTFTVTEFGDVMKRYPNLMNGDDGLKIMLYLSNPPKTQDFKSLPPWLNKSCTKRCVTMQKSYDVPSENISPYDDTCIGKVVFPLRSTNDTQNMTELTSLLQMKCIYGLHEIKAIKLAFQAPVHAKSVIKNITIKIHVHPCGLNVYEHIEVANSLEVTVTFSQAIKVCQGDLVDIEMEAKNMEFYRILQFDGTRCMPANPHFTCCVSSRPKRGKFYFIKEVEYSPQENPTVAPKRRNRRRPNKASKSIILC